MNLVILHGVLNRPAERRSLPSGSELVVLDVTTRGADGAADAVPVSWADPPASAAALDTGTPVVVLGRVRRRFYRAAGNLASRTEVVAERVVVGSHQRRVERLLGEARARLDDPVTAPTG